MERIKYSAVRRWEFDAGISAVLIGGLFAAFVFYTALLPWKVGIWIDTEPMVIALHASALVCASGLLLCLKNRRRLLNRVLLHPAVLVAVLVAVWSVVVAPFGQYPLQSLLGSPQLGEGALFYADIAVFVASGILIRRLKKSHRFFVAVAAAACAATPIFVWLASVLDWDTAWQLFVFDDYLAYFAVAGAILVLTLPELSLRNRGLAAIVIAAPGLLVATNLTALVIVVGLAIPAAFCVSYVLSQAPGSRRLIRGGVAMLAPLLAVVGLIFVWIAAAHDAAPSLMSRWFMHQTLFLAVAEQPAILFYGQGWGLINTTVLTHLTASGAVIWDGSWDLAMRDIPHSHNFALEAMMGAGAPAAIGVVGLLMVLPATRGTDLPAAAFALVAVAGLGAMWFELPATAGLTAIGLGLLYGPTRFRVSAPFVAVAGLLAGIMAVQVLTLFWLLQYGLAVQSAVRDDFSAYDSGQCGWFPDDGFRGDVALVQALDDQLEILADKQLAGQPVGAKDWQRLSRIYCVVSERIASSRSVRLLLADQVFRAEVAFQPKFVEGWPRFATVLSDWPEALRQFLTVAPARTDVAGPYLAWQLANGNPRATLSFSRYLISTNPDDPVGNWFHGAALAAIEGGLDGVNGDLIRKRMRHALALGVERYVEVDPRVIRAITSP